MKMYLKKIKNNWSLFLVLALFLLGTYLMLIISLKITNGHLVYTLDDSYIHMAIAKNFVKHGVWGIDKYKFTNCSSSPLWTLLLSLIYYLFGINTVAPFILNLIFSISLITTTCYLLKKYTNKNSYILFSLLLIILSTPIIPLIFTGLEAIMFIQFALPFVYLSGKILSKKNYNFKEFIPLLIIAPFLVSSRYEGLFLIFIVDIFLVLKKKFLHPFLLTLSGILPIAIYGTISLLNGWFFLPNSVLLKGRIPGTTHINIPRFIHHILSSLFIEIHILLNQISLNILSISGKVGILKFIPQPLIKLFSFIPTVYLFLTITLLIFSLLSNNRGKLWEEKKKVAIIIFTTFILQILFARIGSFYRYEAYIVTIGIFAISIIIIDFLKIKSPSHKKNLLLKGAIISFISIFIFSPFIIRGFISLFRTPKAIKNIYEQQYQMGQFLKRFYKDKTVALNDIGASNYYGDIGCVDLWGIANMEVAKLKKNGKYNIREVKKITEENNVKIAILYEDWFNRFRGLPKSWIKVGSWKISNNVICGGNKVTFFAVDPGEAVNLLKDLKLYGKCLPKDVIQKFYYKQ